MLLSKTLGKPIDDEEKMKMKSKGGFIEIIFPPPPQNITSIIPLGQNIIRTMKMHYIKVS